MSMMKYGAASAVGSLALVANNAMAQDFSGILDGLTATTAITAVVAAGAILASVGFAVWGVKKVARFFG